MTLVSNHSFPRHSHDQFGIGLLRSGAQSSWSGIGQVESHPGDVITVNPGEMHDGVPIDRCVRHWQMLYFDPELLAGEVIGETPRAIEFVRPSLRDRRLSGWFQSLFASLTEAADPLAVEENLLRVILRLLPRERRARPTSARLTPSVAKARARIDEAPACPVSLSELAALTGMSRYRLLRAFSREVGATPHAYVLQRRVRLARRRLLAGDGLAEAALASGFADQSHMTRAFLRQFGVTPGRYRAARA